MVDLETKKKIAREKYPGGVNWLEIFHPSITSESSQYSSGSDNVLGTELSTCSSRAKTDGYGDTKSKGGGWHSREQSPLDILDEEVSFKL